MPACGLFQSLSGFLMSCNRFRFASEPSAVKFQSLSGFLMSCNSQQGHGPSMIGRFQSLSGFLMSCNILAAFDDDRRVSVSIPIGFSNEL